MSLIILLSDKSLVWLQNWISVLLLLLIVKRRCHHRSCDCDLSNRKCFQDFNGIRSHGLCVSAAVLRGCRAPPTELWRPIRWEQDNLLNLLYPWKEWNIWILCELRTYKWSEGVIITPSFHLYVRSSHNISKLLIVLITKCSNMIGCEQPLFMA